MAQYQVLYWMEVPAMVKVHEAGRRPLSRTLPPRFQEYIDRLAMERGLAGTDEYLDRWRWTGRQSRDGAAEDVAEAIALELEREFPT